MLKSFLKDNGLTVVLGLMFLVSLAGMALTGHATFNKELAETGAEQVDLLSYFSTGDFLSALFENWESEFLQMAVYVILTAMLFQRGSSESRDPDDPERPNDKVTWRDGHPVAAWLYEHSLGLALGLLFVGSFLSHWWFSMIAVNAEAMRTGGEVESVWSYLFDSRLWFESFQNWQSEFLSTAVLIVLSIFLRQKGSPESKPAGAANAESGD